MKLYLVLFTSVILMSCTRSLDKSSELKIIIPASSKVQAQESASLVPMFAAVNIHYSDRPSLSRSFELKDRYSDSVNAGTVSTDLEILVPKVTQGSNTLVQLLVVYEDLATGLIEFNYGDVKADISGGENLLDITIASIGSSTQEIEFAGRYLTAASSGPTGLVSIMLHPPNGKPAMEVEKKSINNGWFQFFHPGGGAVMSYVIKAQKKVLFDKITESSPVFTTGNHLLKLDMPLHEFKRDGIFQTKAAQSLFFGFFKDPNSVIDLNTYEVCYPNRKHSILGAYSLPYTNFEPLIYNPAEPVLSDIDIQGGVSKTFEDIYYLNSCDVSSQTQLVLHSEHLSDGGIDDQALGAKGPFQMIKPFHDYESAFVNSKYVMGSSIDLNWSYLPGVLGSSITGTAVFAKYEMYNTGDDSHYDNLDCREQAEIQGMIPVGDVTVEQYSFTGASGFPNLSDPNTYPESFRFMLCPYKQTPSGERLYSERGLKVHCIGGCQQTFNYGMGAEDYTVPPAGQVISTVTDVFGARVDSISPAGDATDIIFNNVWGNIANLKAGDEVIFNVIAAGGVDGTCPTSSGSNHLGPGYFEFGRVLNNSGSLITVTKSEKLESITAASLSDALDPAISFCLLTITKVMQFKNLTIDGLLSSEYNALSTDQKVKNIFIKVAGKLTFSGSAHISLTEKGFAGGPTYANGGGINGQEGSSSSTGSGGSYGSGFSGGGASYGSGGQNSSSEMAQGVFHDGMYMGGGGGGSASSSGLSGGGILYLTARHLDSQVDTYIESNGGDANTPGSNGAGAGGNIWLLFDEVVGSGLVSVHARGGDTLDSAGAGGGGYINSVICYGNLALFDYEYRGGVSGAGSPGSEGYLDAGANSRYSWACDN